MHEQECIGCKPSRCEASIDRRCDQQVPPLPHDALVKPNQPMSAWSVSLAQRC